MKRNHQFIGLYGILIHETTTKCLKKMPPECVFGLKWPKIGKIPNISTSTLRTHTLGVWQSIKLQKTSFYWFWVQP